MAFNHIHFSQATQHGSKLRQVLTLMEQGDDLLADVRDAMIQMRDGDGTQDAHYTEVAKRFGFGDYDVTTGGAPSTFALGKARAAFEELDSAYSKTSGNGSVSNVRAARDQLFAKLRG
jgi:hypothetical protein